MTAGLSTPFLPGEQALGSWIGTQRKYFRGQLQPPLAVKRIEALEGTPGWSWGLYLQKPWEVGYQQVQDFVRQHGRLPKLKPCSGNSERPGEKELGAWMDKQRRKNKRQKLSVEQIATLEAIPGWCWAEWSQEPWESRLKQVQAFVSQHGRIPRPQGSKRMPLQANEGELGTWCSGQRQRQKGSAKYPQLTAEQQAALTAIPGWSWDDDDRWEQQRQQLEAFVLQHGRMPRMRAGRREPLLDGEQELGIWRIGQRQRQRGTGRRAPLTAKQLAALQAIPLW